MFTGIVQARGRIAALERNAFGVHLAVDSGGWRPRGSELAYGDSVCVSGVCLTLVSDERGLLGFDVIAETLARTTLGTLEPGDQVNLEPSLTPSTPLGGHFMQGHVDGVGEIAQVAASAKEWRLTIRPPVELMDYVIPKGSIAIDGVSLTVAAVGASDFEVALIPTTLQITTLGKAQRGGRVNLEADILAKTVVHFLRRQADGGRGVTMEGLRSAGIVS